MLQTSPHLAALTPTGNLAWLDKFIEKKTEIEAWFVEQFNKHLAPLYTSVDLRFSGPKLAPVDTNLFSAGFNNISKMDYPLAVSAIKNVLLVRDLPKKWLLVPENHTRNIAYWENIAIIQQLFSAAGCTIQIGSLLPELSTKKSLSLDFGNIELHPLGQTEKGLAASGFYPDAILLNNDLAEGVPHLFKNLPHPIYPPTHVGWHNRRKSHHARLYQAFAQQFAELIGIDPWLISTLETTLDDIDLDENNTLEALKKESEKLLIQLNERYKNDHIDQAPFLMLKADAGTYGQAVMSITSADIFLSLTRKQKEEMRFTKGKQPVRSVLLQEGVYTVEYFPEDHAVAEPVIYLINGEAIGGFYRVNKKQNDHDNLNKPGMRFVPFSLTQLLQSSQDLDYRRCYAYTVIARLATLAAAKETEELLV
ncbi:MAG: glutamate--cysteine ligase [Gammaproteobacteria bacterium]|nr:glutamate--cysteine ligase [Gammaproteobacteria bacterium]